MAGPWRAAFKNALIVVISLSCAVAALEVATRIYSRLFFSRMMEMDDRLGWREQFAHIEAQRTSAAQWHEDLAALAQRWLD